MNSYLSREEIIDWKPYIPADANGMGEAIARTRTRVEVAKVWAPNQVLGRRYSIGCVALEITQRCNLDCTLCYLSEMSESTKDIPMSEIYRRIERIKNHFGPGTDIQITGGDPTLRKRSELMEIIRRVREMGMRPTLMTNGIAATRDLIQEMISNGLNDIAFHVDLTQERKGFKTEMEMNEIRLKYIERARNLPIAVVFNTTVFDGNFQEIPALIQFFKAHTDVVGMASFQLQADTGRGVLRERDQIISLDTVCDQIQKGAGSKISFESVRIGHPKCHRYGLTLEADGKLHDIFDSEDFFAVLVEATKTLEMDRRYPSRVVVSLAKWLFSTPQIILPGLKFILRKLWQMKGDVVRARGKVRKLSFFVQNFMDASKLEADRLHACSFMVMTPEGPMSMCLHNAKRDDYITKPIVLEKTEQIWNPLTGELSTCASSSVSA